MSITINNVTTGLGGDGNALVFEVNSDITSSFSSDDRITITNSGTTFQNLTEGAATTLNNASGGTSDFQIREISYDGGLNRTQFSIELQGTTTIIDISGGPPTDGGVSGLTFVAYSGGGGGGGGSGSGKTTVKLNGKTTVKLAGKITVK